MQTSTPALPTMNLRPRRKGVENLRLANLQDYVITEDTPDLSPRTSPPLHPRLLARRIHNDTYNDIMASFKKFTWDAPKIDGLVLCNYRRFTNAMIVPTTEAIKPWCEWVQEQLGWEKKWILENPVAAKQEVVRKFEGEERDDVPKLGGSSKLTGDGRAGSTEFVDEIRQGAVGRSGFRDEEEQSAPPFAIINAKENNENAIHCENEDKFIMSRRKLGPLRPNSAIGFREKAWKINPFSFIKKKALTNPWQRSEHPVRS